MPIEFLGLSPPEKMAPPLQGFELETNRNKTVFFSTAPLPGCAILIGNTFPMVVSGESLI
jgi:hypothetical protein